MLNSIPVAPRPHPHIDQRYHRHFLTLLRILGHFQNTLYDADNADDEANDDNDDDNDDSVDGGGDEDDGNGDKDYAIGDKDDRNGSIEVNDHDSLSTAGQLCKGVDFAPIIADLDLVHRNRCMHGENGTEYSVESDFGFTESQIRTTLHPLEGQSMGLFPTWLVSILSQWKWASLLRRFA